MIIRKWRYCWLHIPTGNTGQAFTTEMTPHEFLSLLAWWNTDERWIYWPDLSSNLQGIIPRATLAELETKCTSAG